MDQRLSLVTLGVADVDAARSFYEGLGWRASGASVPGEVAFFQAGGAVLALWSAAALAAEAAIAAQPPGSVALAHNVRSATEVDAVLERAAAAGATVTRPGGATEWGGYAGTFVDPDGHPWEVAHNPHWPLAADGTLRAVAPAARYDERAAHYARRRQADPRIAARIHAALGDAGTVLNVGAGIGSYEPSDRRVVAVEPSAAMRAARPVHLTPAVDARAEALPLDDESVDAAMAIATVHQWDDLAAGIAELRRVARRRIVVLTWDVDALASFWLVADHVPELHAVEASRFPTVASLGELLGGAVVEDVPIPASCADGFLEAYFGRPERFLDEDVRAAQSTWALLPKGTEERAVASLRADLGSGRWDERHGTLRHAASCDGSLRLLVADAGRGRVPRPHHARSEPRSA